MDRGELNEKIAEAIFDAGCRDGDIDGPRIFCDDPRLSDPADNCACKRSAEACLSAIEQSGCTICDEVSCNRPEQAEKSVSPDKPALQSGSGREADNRLDCQLVSFMKGSELFLARAQQAIDAAKSSDHKLAVLANYGDMALERLVHGVALLRQIEEPRSGDTDPST